MNINDCAVPTVLILPTFECIKHEGNRDSIIQIFIILSGQSPYVCKWRIYLVCESCCGACLIQSKYIVWDCQLYRSHFHMVNALKNWHESTYVSFKKFNIRLAAQVFQVLRIAWRGYNSDTRASIYRGTTWNSITIA